MECYYGGRNGHFKNSAACKKKGIGKGKDQAKKGTQRNQKARKVDESSDGSTEDSATDSIRRVTLSVRASTGKGSKATEVRMQVLDHGHQTSRGVVNLLIVSGVNKTLLSERDWHRLQAYSGRETR